MSVNHPEGFIYKYYYAFVNGRWDKREFNEETYKSSNWIKDEATDWLRVETAGLAIGENYVVAYSCKKYNNNWKCGCGNYNCNQWMLNSFLYRNVDLPPEPIEPGSVITQRVWINPNGDLISQDENTPINIYFESSNEDIQELEETLTVAITDQQEKVTEVVLEKTSDVYCNTGDNYFNCHVGFYGETSGLALGDYTIDLPGVSSETTKVEPGYFKIVSASFLDDFFITENIGNFEFGSRNGHSHSDDVLHVYSSYYHESSSAYVDIKFPKDELNLYDGFKDLGDGLYRRINPDDYAENKAWISHRWLSETFQVNVEFYTKEGEVLGDDEQIVLDAYLEKYPLAKELVLEKYPQNIMNQDETLNAIIVVGDAAPSGDIVAAQSIVENLADRGYNVLLAPIKLASEVADPYAQKVISIGSPCNNAITAVLLGNPDPCNLAIPAGEGMLKGMTNNSQLQILVAGNEEVDTRIAAEVLTDIEDYEITSDTVCMTQQGNAIILEECIAKESTCTDSDGGNNISVQGTTVCTGSDCNYKEPKTDWCGSSPKGFIEVVDSCTGSDSTCEIAEFSCVENGMVERGFYRCENGCADGACIPAPPIDNGTTTIPNE